MRGRARQAEAARLLRVADWGELFAVEETGGPARIREDLLVADGTGEAVLALADRWRALSNPCFSHVILVELATRAGAATPAVRIERLAPRGSVLSEVAARAGRLEERVVAAALLDLGRALLEAHAQGLVAGFIAPQAVVLCTPGLDGAAAVQVCGAGLPGLVRAAGQAPVDADNLRFQQVFPSLDTVAPEVLAGQDPTAAADAYGLCATAAFLLLRRHAHLVANPAGLRHEAERGVAADTAEALRDAAPASAGALLRGLSPSPWARAGALAELVQAWEGLVRSAPTFDAGGRRMLAPWAIGSPLIPLAAFAGSTPWADRLRAAAPTAAPTSPATAAAPLPGALAGAASLRAALHRLEAERTASQRNSAAQGQKLLAKLVVVVLFALLAAAIVAIGVRQVARHEHRLRAAATMSGIERTPPPVPQPRILMEMPEE